MQQPRMLHQHWVRHSTFLFVVGAIVLAAVACGPTDPIAQLESVRSEFEVKINSFTVRQEPVEASPEPGEDVVSAEEPPAEEGGEDEYNELATTVILDILVQNNSHESLDGITVECYHKDSAGNDKAVFQIYLETKGFLRGLGNQVTHELENVENYEENDQFGVVLLSPVPEADRGAYREFQGIGG